MQIGGRDLDANAVTVTMAGNEFVENRDLVESGTVKRWKKALAAGRSSSGKRATKSWSASVDERFWSRSAIE